MKVLAKLAAHANQIVSRDDLIRTAWEGRAITDDGVAQCIKDIRLALRDSEHRIVETCHKRGYRLNIAPASEVAAVKRPKVVIERIAVTDPSDEASALALSIHEQLLAALAPRTGIRVVVGDSDQEPADYLVAGRLSLSGASLSLFVRLITPNNGQVINVEQFELEPSPGRTDS